MNERIFELADQASTQWIGGSPVTSNGYPITRPYNDDFAILFAELIVRECAALIPAEQSHAPDGRPLLKIFQEHFGVDS